MARGVILAVVAALCLSLFAGCNTIHGIGKDVESAGRAIEKSSGK